MVDHVMLVMYHTNYVSIAKQISFSLFFDRHGSCDGLNLRRSLTFNVIIPGISVTLVSYLRY